MVWILVLTVLICLLLEGALLLQIPFLFAGRASLSSAASLVLTLSWGPVSVCHTGAMYGKTAVQVAGKTLYQKTGDPTESETDDEADGEADEQKKRTTNILNLLRCISEPLLTTFRSISFDHWFCAFRCGTGDPATTGELYGYVQGFRSILAPCPEIELQMTPDFCEVVLEGETDLAFRIDRPFFLLPQVVYIVRCAMHTNKGVKST